MKGLVEDVLAVVCLVCKWPRRVWGMDKHRCCVTLGLCFLLAAKARGDTAAYWKGVGVAADLWLRVRDLSLQLDSSVPLG